MTGRNDAPDLLAALAGVPANRAVLSFLEQGARSRPIDDPWALDGYELHTHPDLQERLDQVAVGQPGGRSIGMYGVPVLVSAGVIYAVARGTSRIYLRIPAGPARDEVLHHGGAVDDVFGPAWVVADAWLSDVPSAEGTRLLRSWVATSASMVTVDA